MVAAFYRFQDTVTIMMTIKLNHVSREKNFIYFLSPSLENKLDKSQSICWIIASLNEMKLNREFFLLRFNSLKQGLHFIKTKFIPCQDGIAC